MKKKTKEDKNTNFTRSLYFLIIGLVVIAIGALAYFYKPLLPNPPAQQIFQKTTVLTRKFVYEFENKLFLYDLSSQKQQEVQLPVTSYDQITWKDDGSSFLALTSNGTLYLINPKTLRGTLLLQDFQGVLHGWSKKTPDTLVLSRRFLNDKEINARKALSEQSTEPSSKFEEKYYLYSLSTTVKEISPEESLEETYPQNIKRVLPASLDDSFKHVSWISKDNYLESRLLDSKSKKEYSLPQGSTSVMVSPDKKYVAYIDNPSNTTDLNGLKVFTLSDVFNNSLKKPVIEDKSAQQYVWLDEKSLIALKQLPPLSLSPTQRYVLYKITIDGQREDLIPVIQSVHVNDLFIPPSTKTLVYTTVEEQKDTSQRNYLVFFDLTTKTESKRIEYITASLSPLH